jgi:hypothetical protein
MRVRFRWTSDQLFKDLRGYKSDPAEKVRRAGNFVLFQPIFIMIGKVCWNQMAISLT